MLRNRVKIDNREYVLRKGSYQKQRANVVVPRFATERLDVSDLTVWNWWAQSLWHEGFDQEFITSDPPAGFTKSENLDSVYQAGELKLAADVSAHAKVSGVIQAQLAPFVQGGTRYIYLGGQRSFGKMKVWRGTFLSTDPTSAWADASGGTVLSMSEFATPTIERLYIGTNPNFGNNYLKYTTNVSFVNDTNWASANGQPEHMTTGEGFLWLLTSNLYQYDGTTVTQKTADTASTANRGYGMEYANGDLYWIRRNNNQGYLHRYDISADTGAEIFRWPGQFDPKFIRKFKNFLIIGGKDLSKNAAALYRFSLLDGSMEPIHLWEQDDDEDQAEYGFEYDNVFLITITGGSNTWVYAYDGQNLSPYIKEDDGTLGAGQLQANLGRLIMGSGVAGKEIRYGKLGHQLSGEVESSKVDFDLFGVQKYFGGLTVYHKPLPSGSYIKLKVRIDDDTDWDSVTVAGSNSVADSVAFDVELLSDNLGKKIEYYLQLSGTGASDNTPKLDDIAIRYLLNPENKWEWQFDLLLIDNIENTQDKAETMKVNLEAALTKLLVNFTDVDEQVYDASKPGTTDRGVILQNVQFLGPWYHGDRGTEYIARVTLLEG